MGDIILSGFSILIVLTSVYFKLSLKKIIILFVLNLLGIICNFLYYSMQAREYITSAPPEVFGLLYTYKSMIAFVVCVIVIIVIKYFEYRNSNT